MIISAIVAVSQNQVIGNQNRLPWHLSADLRYFKQVTLGKPIIMGRKTYEAIGRPLPQRKNIVITRNPTFHAEGCIVQHSVEEALESLSEEKEVFIIGGAELYKQTFPLLQYLYLTRIQHNFAGDTFFPDLNPKEWKEIKCESHLPDEKNAYPYTFFVYERCE